MLQIARLVNKGSIVADIGTDHAYLPIHLVKQGICKQVYACDIAKGPLQYAQNNIDKAGLATNIQIILTDGIKDVPSDANTLVIAGMGYHTIVYILSQKSLEQFSQVILQSNTDVHLLRKWIFDMGYGILNEVMINEKGHYYTIIELDLYNPMTYTEDDLYIGPCLKKQYDQIVYAYCQKHVSKINHYLSYQKDLQQKKELETQRQCYENYLAVWKKD